MSQRELCNEPKAPREQAAGGATATCSLCSMAALCATAPPVERNGSRLAPIVERRRHLARGEHLIHIDEESNNRIYIVRSGFFKTYQIDRRGGQQVIGFPMAGDAIGMDALSSPRMQCGAVALAESEVCEVPIQRVQSLIRHAPVLLHRFHMVLSVEIARQQNVAQLLRNLHAEQRFAIFLLDLSARFEQHGGSPTAFRLHMSRQEIGDYLGVTSESISRLFTKFVRRGYLDIDHRTVLGIDLPRLREVAASHDGDGWPRD